ncbi:unnamed protein product [Clonostachys byssicola]|uniref:Uncharacterized protein n=1 Tax=Clonostachys byssicola TaxID=160290 RepID=A0A9N9UCB4_9HYPO|nr:unnamed protein product [Clonostachys byssicola]
MRVQAFFIVAFAALAIAGAVPEQGDAFIKQRTPESSKYCGGKDEHCSADDQCCSKQCTWRPGDPHRRCEGH